MHLIRAPKYMKQKLTQRKEDINNSVIIVGNFNTPYSIMGRTALQKDSKEIGNVSSTVLSYTSRCLWYTAPAGAEAACFRSVQTYSLE